MYINLKTAQTIVDILLKLYWANFTSEEYDIAMATLPEVMKRLKPSLFDGTDININDKNIEETFYRFQREVAKAFEQVYKEKR